MKKLYIAGILMLVAAVISGCGEIPTLPDAGVPNRVSQSDKPDFAPSAPARPTTTETTETPAGVSNESDSRNATPAQPPEENNGRKFFENERLGFRFPISPNFAVEEMAIPEEATRFTAGEQTIGYFRVKNGNNEPFFLITVETFEEGLNPDDTPRVVPAEGGLTNEFTLMPFGIKGYHYLSNAMGYYDDAHITAFRQDRIFYLRMIGVEASIVPTLIDFAEKFEITR